MGCLKMKCKNFISFSECFHSCLLDLYSISYELFLELLWFWLLLFNDLTWWVLLVKIGTLLWAWKGSYSVNECPMKSLILLPILLPSIYHHLVCTHFSLIVHAISASEATVSFELDRVNHKGPEIIRRWRSSQPDKRSPKRRSSALMRSQLRSWKASPGAS